METLLTCSELVMGQGFLKSEGVFYFVLFALLLRAAAAGACGSSQARGQIRATGAGLDAPGTATWDRSHDCELHRSSGQPRILNSLIGARDQIRATAASLRHSHSNEGPEPHRQQTLQLTAMPESWTH